MQRMLRYAEREARESGSRQLLYTKGNAHDAHEGTPVLVDTHHILLALFAERGGIAASVLYDHGVPASLLRIRTHRLARREPSSTRASDNPKLSRRAQRALKRAASLARHLRAPFTGSEQVLLALSSQSDGVTSAVLRSLAVTPRRIRATAAQRRVLVAARPGSWWVEENQAPDEIVNIVLSCTMSNGNTTSVGASSLEHAREIIRGPWGANQSREEIVTITVSFELADGRTTGITLPSLEEAAAVLRSDNPLALPFLPRKEQSPETVPMSASNDDPTLTPPHHSTRVVRARGGHTIEIRDAVPDDAAALLAYFRRVGAESPHLTFGVEGVELTEAEEREHIARMQRTDNALLLVATAGDEIVGSLGFNGGLRARTRHIGEFGITVVQTHWGEGIGRALIESLIAWATAGGVIRKIDLRVRADNPRAIALYERLGFTIEGKLTRTVSIDGEFLDGFLMGLPIDPHGG